MTNKHWVGNLRGSRFGPLYWTQLEHGEGNFSATTADSLVFSYRTFPDPIDPNKINLFVTAPDANGNRQLVGSLVFGVASETHRNGTWEFQDGSKGIFDLTLCELPLPTTIPTAQSQSVRLWNKETPLGAITLYRSDVERLIAELESFIPEPASTIIKATEDGQVIFQTAADYLERRELPDVLKQLSIIREEIVTSGFKKIATINLDDENGNNITISSPDEIWTTAASQRISGFMSQFTSALTGLIRKRGLDLNALILLIVVIILPDYPINHRILIVFLVVLFVLVIARYHKFVRLARVYLDPDRIKRPYAKQIPSAIITASVAIFTVLINFIPTLIQKLQKLISLFL